MVPDVQDIGDVETAPEVSPPDTANPDIPEQETGPTIPDGVATDQETTACVPDCAGKECGDDGCGQSCGGCEEPRLCVDGECQCAHPNQIGDACDACAPGYIGANCDEMCTMTGFAVGEAEAWQDSELNEARYQAFSAASFPREMLAMHIYSGSPRFGPSETGVYELTGSTFADCGLCLMAESDCHDFLCLNCDSHFFADEGRVHITSFWGDDGVFSATFEGVVFREVSIDMETHDSAVIPGGMTWCMDGFTFTCTNGLCAVEP